MATTTTTTGTSKSTGTGTSTAGEPRRSSPSTTPGLGRGDGSGLTSARPSALVAGLALLAMTVIGVLANFVAIGGLVTEGDPAGTATSVADSESLFRFGILGLAAVAVLDIVVAWALFDTFKAAHPNLARLAGWFRAVYAAILLVAVTNLQDAVRHVGSGGTSANSTVLDGFEAYQDVWALGLGVFGIHLIIAGWLTWRTPWLPRLLGALVSLAGLGYVADTVGTVLSADYDTNLAAYTFFGEPLLMIWLLVHGWKAVRSTTRSSAVDATEDRGVQVS